LINPLIPGNLRHDPWKAVRFGFVIAVQTCVLLARIGMAGDSAPTAGTARAMIAHWLSGLLLFVFWAGFCIAVLDRYVDVVERSAEFGLLRIFGASYTYFLRLLIQETLLSAVPGFFFGIVFAYLLSASFQFVSNGLITIPVPYLWWPAAGLLASAGSLLGAAIAIPGAVKEGVLQAL
jgi:hypothetical protein